MLVDKSTETVNMKEHIRKLLNKTEFIVLVGLVLVPVISFVFILTSPESPLYTSISRIAWVHDRWLATFFWATIVMGTIVWLTYKLIKIGPMEERHKRIFFTVQLVSICLVFVGCLLFPAKPSPDSIRFVHYMHDYLTIAAWAMYGIGLFVYSYLLRRYDRFLGFLGLGLMSFIVFSSAFFISRVVDPASYVGASAVSEVYIINSLFIYLVVMYLAEKLKAGKYNCEAPSSRER